MTPVRIQRLRGTHDIYGEDALLFQKMEQTAKNVFNRFGFEELRTPVMEEKELFSRALGTETDVVKKEMYEFEDRSKTQVALRPEGTAGIVRAYLENSLDKKEGLCKFYYMGPMFRSERPQAGRLRQFHQIGVEQLGTDSPYADAETIHALTVFLDEAGASGYRVKLNNLGTFEERKKFREELTGYFTPLKNSLCEDCRSRLERNVFRILDCKVEFCREMIRKSPPIRDFLTPESKAHFEKVGQLLKDSGVSYTEDPYMVRGLDYYTRTVFELSHEKLGAQDALAAGGRYDKLVESFGGPSVGAVGFAVGIERLLMCVKGPAPAEKSYEESFFMVALGEAAFKKATEIVFKLRAAHVKALMDFNPSSMKSQMRSADKNKCRYAVILGDNELEKGTFVLKNLEIGEQKEYSLPDVIEVCKKNRKFL